MPRLDTVLVVLLAMPAAAFANAGSTRNVREIRADQRQIAAAQDWNERDAREISEFEKLMSSLRDANEDRMTGRYRDVNARVQAAMSREIEQAQVKSALMPWQTTGTAKTRVSRPSLISPDST